MSASDPLRTYRNQNRPKRPRREALRLNYGSPFVTVKGLNPRSASAAHEAAPRCGKQPTIRRPLGFDDSDQRLCPPSPAKQFQQESHLARPFGPHTVSVFTVGKALVDTHSLFGGSNCRCKFLGRSGERH